MVSLVFTQDNILAAAHNKRSGRPLFTMPLAIEDGGYVGVARRVKQELKKVKHKDRIVKVILMENVVFKELSHQSASAKMVESFARLEARTVLGDQADNFAVSCMSYGEYRNDDGETGSMLLATPITLLKGLRGAFAGEGLRLEGVYSGFEAYTNICARLLPKVMGTKTCAAIDFSDDYTLINIYANGMLASQRRLQGLRAALVPALASTTQLTKEEIAKMVDSNTFTEEAEEKLSSVFTDFVWDVLRTVRVVCAPLHIDMEGFFISGQACKEKLFCEIIRNNMGSDCVFADDLIDAKTAKFAKPITSSLVNMGAVLCKTDLMYSLKAKRRTGLLDATICLIVAAVTAVGMAVQPIALLSANGILNIQQTRLDALAPISAAMDKVVAANGKLQSIETKKAMLGTYTSNVGTTLPDVMAIFTGDLVPSIISYEGMTGTYTINFNAPNETAFLAFKAEVYKNSKFYLNLSLSSNANNFGTLDCTLSFTPASYVPLPEPVVKEVKAEEEISAETIMKNLGE